MGRAVAHGYMRMVVGVGVVVGAGVVGRVVVAGWAREDDSEGKLASRLD